MSLETNEFNRRMVQIRTLMEKSELDFLFIYFDEYNVMNGRYLTGWCPSVERGAVVVPREGEPFLLGGPEAAPYAKLDSKIKTTVNSSLFMVPGEEYPGAEILNINEIISKYLHNISVDRVGIVGSNTIPYVIYSQLLEKLPNSDFIDVTYDFEMIRSIKSEWEFTMLSKAYACADAGIKALTDKIQEGKHEYEAAAAGEFAARDLGSDGWGYRTIVGAAERSSGIIPPASERKFGNGEIVIAGISPRYNGYNSTACCPVVVGGDGNEKQKRWIADVTEALLLTKEELKPGLTGVEIDQVPRDFLIKKGYEDYMPMPFVHSTGLSEYENPFFGPNSNEIIKENQAICIDISLFGDKDIPGIRVETGYRVTDKGAVPLSSYMDNLLKS